MSESTRLEPAELVSRLATMACIAPQHVRAILQAQAQLASECARSDYPVPGIGVLQVIDTPARTLVMQFGPKKGQTVELPPRKKLAFRVCKAMKDVVFGESKRVPDLFDPRLFEAAWYPPTLHPED